MKYKIGEKVKFRYDVYEIYNNVELEYEETVELIGSIVAINDGKYVIEASNGIAYTIEESDVISSEMEDKIAAIKIELIEQKIKIANTALKLRDALYGCDHPAHHKECSEKLDKLKEEFFDLMSEYDNIEDKYIMSGGEKVTY